MDHFCSSQLMRVTHHSQLVVNSQVHPQIQKQALHSGEVRDGTPITLPITNKSLEKGEKNQYGSAADLLGDVVVHGGLIPTLPPSPKHATTPREAGAAAAAAAVEAGMTLQQDAEAAATAAAAVAIARNEHAVLAAGHAIWAARAAGATRETEIRATAVTAALAVMMIGASKSAAGKVAAKAILKFGGSLPDSVAAKQAASDVMAAALATQLDENAAVDESGSNSNEGKANSANYTSDHCAGVEQAKRLFRLTLASLAEQVNRSRGKNRSPLLRRCLVRLLRVLFAHVVT
jgi:hypothetical protein